MLFYFLKRSPKCQLETSCMKAFWFCNSTLHHGFFLDLLYTAYMKSGSLVSDSSSISGCSVKMAAVFQRSVFCIFKPVSGAISFQTRRVLSASATKVAAFDDPRVQVLLKRITGRNLDKVLASRSESGVGSPSYKLMTDEELSLVCSTGNFPITAYHFSREFLPCQISTIIY